MRLIRGCRFLDVDQCFAVRLRPLRQHRYRLTTAQLTVLGSLQIAATAGLLWGIWFPPFAVAAAIGLVLSFGGAIGAHLRGGDRNMLGAIIFLALSSATSAVLVLDVLAA